jgi:hypothetical protein
MCERKAGLDQLSIDLVKEAELNGIGCIAPDGKVGSTLCDDGAQCAGISGKHERYLAVFWIVNSATDE